MTSRSRLTLDRQVAISSGGMVAAKTIEAAEAGAAVLADGGNAVDAAVATAFAAAVAEPWMNGLGGGGYLVRYDPKTGDGNVVSFPMVSPAAATPEMFPLTGGGPDAALFGWPEVADSLNIVGPLAVAAPGTVPGLDLALQAFGSRSLAQLLEPAISIAEKGISVTWHTSLEIARDLANLRRFGATKAIYCPNDLVPWSAMADRPARILNPDLAESLRTIAREGASAFSTGSIASAIDDWFRASGGLLTGDDLTRYEAKIEPALQFEYHDALITTTGGATGGFTLAESLLLLNGSGIGDLPPQSAAAYHLMAQAFSTAFADRFAYLADPDHVDVPFRALLSAEYLDGRRIEFSADPVTSPRAGDRQALGVQHDLPGSLPDYTSGGSTTHLSVVDRDGVAVSLTQTLLSLWGSRVTVPGTGIMMNNGMMWFDPTPGRPNSVGGSKRPLSNMSPAIVSNEHGMTAAVGASGGRRIMNCVAQIAMNLVDHKMGMQEAVSAPRIDRSTATLLISDRVPVETVSELESLGHTVDARDESLQFGEFSSPACVRFVSGQSDSGVDPFYYPATAIGVDS